MMHLNHRCICLIIGIFFISTTLIGQTINFNETWKEFLENNKISNMSALAKPNKVSDKLDYIKYALMNTNSSFCQSNVKDAEKWVAEINDIDVRAHQAIPGFVNKLDDLEKKIKAYHSIDAIWQEFVQTKEVDIDALESIKAAKSLCEKRTLAKYSYMLAYNDFCQGNVSQAKNIIETRTLRLTEKTTLRVEDVKGLAPELAKMKKLFRALPKLETTWKKYIRTGVSPGFDMELPLFTCNPIPNMKEWVLNGAADVCGSGAVMLEKIKDLQDESGVTPDRDLAEKITELETAIGERTNNLDALNEAWEAFIPNNEVAKGKPKYGYEYCEKEPLIRAYIMDGFADACGRAEEMLQKIDALQQAEVTELEEITMIKLSELVELQDQYQYDAVAINKIWDKFVAQGDVLYEDHQLADYYCDHIYDVKSWIIKGLSSNCKEGIMYLEKIDEFKETIEFDFAKDVRCRVEKLRLKVWDCGYQTLSKLARAQATDVTFEEKMEELMKEYGMGERPQVCLE